MKKNILLFLVFFWFLSGITYGNFNGGFTPISSGTTFSKVKGTAQSGSSPGVLRVYEDFFINPFEKSTIQLNVINGINSNYTVDGRAFNSGHPLYKSNGTYLDSAWVQSGDGIKTKRQYLGNTYTNIGGVLTPNQNVRIRKYYEVTFQHDTTPPTCGDLELYNDENLTKKFTYNGGWLNSDKFYTMSCVDTETKCVCEESDTSCIIAKDGRIITAPKVLGHLSKPDASFINNVNLRNPSCVASKGPTIMYDVNAITIDLYYDNNNLGFSLESNREYEKKSNGKKLDGEESRGEVSYRVKNIFEKKAIDKTFKLKITDPFFDKGISGVSGIQKYSLDIYRKDLNSTQSWGTSPYYSTGVTYKEEFNPNGKINKSDVKDITLNDFSLKKSGNYEMRIVAYDWAGNTTKVVFNFNIYPEMIDQSKIELKLSETPNSIYANNVDKYNYTFIFKDKFGNFIQDKNIESIEHYCLEAVSECKNLYLDMVGNKGSSALTITTDNKINSKGEVKFSLQSYSPGEYTQRFKIIYPEWGDDFELTGKKLDITKEFFINSSNINSFRKPYTGKLLSSLDNGNNWDAIPGVGNTYLYRLELLPYADKGIKIEDLNLEDLKNEKVSVKDPENHIIISKNFKKLYSFNPTFEARIDMQPNAKNLSSPSTQINPFIISYKLGGKNIKYLLSQEDSATDLTPINIEGEEFLGVRVVGGIQGSGKSDFTGQEENISNLYNTDQRTQIRKNAYDFIKNMESGQVLNGVKYVKGDYTLSSLDIFETLVILDGNLTIKNDFNKDNKKLKGIIVLQDNYNTSLGVKQSGNIFIASEVKNINAIIYADGGIISADSNGNPYNEDNSQRTAELQNQLILNGSIFTRNTIGGAILGGGLDKKGDKYILPGGSTTTNYDQALIYDLNYIRRGNKNCEKDKDNKCLYIEPFVIKYDSRIQTSPPKLFVK